MGESLNNMMATGHVVRVHGDGTVTDAPERVYGPEGAYVHTEGAEPHLDATGWELMTGYTGQYGYRGPVMHESEYIGGALERDIRERPGLYVVLAVDHLRVGETVCHGCGAPEGEWCVDECDADRESLTEGWVVAYREYPAWRFTPDELEGMPDADEPDRLGWVLKVDRDLLRVYLNTGPNKTPHGSHLDVYYEVRMGDGWYKAEDDRADEYRPDEYRARDRLTPELNESPKLVVRLDTEWSGGQDRPRGVTLYHFTDAAEEIVKSQEWHEPVEGAVFFSDRKDGMATGYGGECVSVTMPVNEAWLNDEFPDGEKHYSLPPEVLAGVPISYVYL